MASGACSQRNEDMRFACRRSWNGRGHFLSRAGHRPVVSWSAARPHEKRATPHVGSYFAAAASAAGTTACAALWVSACWAASPLPKRPIGPPSIACTFILRQFPLEGAGMDDGALIPADCTVEEVRDYIADIVVLLARIATAIGDEPTAEALRGVLDRSVVTRLIGR